MIYATYTRYKENDNYYSDPSSKDIIQTNLTFDGKTFLCYLTENYDGSLNNKFNIKLLNSSEDALTLVKSWYPEDNDYFILEEGFIKDNRPIDEEMI